MEKNKTIVFVEISILIIATFAFSYLIDKSDDYYGNDSSDLIETLKKLRDIILGDNLVSALNENDLKEGVATCLKTKEGSYCQEFPLSECNDKCDGACVPTSREQVAECKIGTCYDEFEGTCQVNSPKQLCENHEGKWFDDPFGNILECKRGCCVIGDEAIFSTAQQCNAISVKSGLEKIFKPEINTELGCYFEAKIQEEGACVFEGEEKNGCLFITKSSCLTKNGEFYSGYLCSHPELGTECERQERSACVEGKDEIYWFDSCGNRENIYDANKQRSWNNGKILPKSESCSLGNGLLNQKTCGNCEYLSGSICSEKTSSERLSDNSQSFVCKDLSCVDSNGKERSNGESWCSYQGSIGVDELNNRATDVPGSRHFRQACIDGEVRTEACDDYRNGICSEQPITGPQGTFSTASCRLNPWQVCLSYNEVGKLDKCNENPDCFIKNVDIGKSFKFSVCSPQYPPGFNLERNAEGAESICSLGNQKCTVVYQKTLFSGWKCKQNCNCEKAVFAHEMNDLCMSLGDCGGSVNIEGDYSGGFKIISTGKKPKATEAYKQALETYKNPIVGKFAKHTNLSIYSRDGAGDYSVEKEGAKTFLDDFGTIVGFGGLALMAASWAFPGLSYGAGFSLEGGVNVLQNIFPAGGVQQLAIFAGPIIAAGMAVSAVTLLVKLLGVDIDPGTLTALQAAGGFGGAISYLAYGPLKFGEGTLLGPLGIAILVAVVIIIIVLKLLGIGKTKKKTVEFQCLPWQPQNGGEKCAECGEDGLPCSRYTCNSLGLTCEFINEGTGNEECIDVGKNDTSVPVISPLSSALQENYEYEDVNANGYTLKSSEGCAKAQEIVGFGIELNEPGQCKLDVRHTSSYDDMEEYFGSRNLYLRNHTMQFLLPSLESLGIPGYDPNRQTDYNLYVRCKDASGNFNVNEYVINFCLKPGNDLTAPKISAKTPQYVAWNVTEYNMDLFTNEPSDCRWSNTDESYDLMSNSLICNNGLEEQELGGWKCSSSVPLNAEENKFYVRCADQPWLIESVNGSKAYIVVEEEINSETITVEDSEDIVEQEANTTILIETDQDKKKNKNQESFVFSIIRSKTNLNIDSLIPDNETIISGVEPVSVTIEAVTSGGIDGRAKCSFSFGSQYTEFLNTWKTKHTQILGSMMSGNYTLNVACEDLAGNVAQRSSRFSILVDTQPPIVTRAYNQNGNLIIITNEKSQCTFTIGDNSNVCNYDFLNGTLMSGSELVHSTSFDGNRGYYIKCKDEFGNVPGGCNIIVKDGQ